MVGEFARLQRTHPGTTGWLTSDGGPSKAFIDFDPADVTLAQVMSGSLVNTSRFADPELGWGPARAAADQFSDVFTDPGTRKVLDDLRGVDGVAEIGEDGVVVRTGKAFAQVRAYAATSEQDLRISLLRAPVLYGFPTDPVFTSTRDDTARITAAYAALADLPGIARLDVNDVSEFGNLVVDDQVTPGELTTVFTALAGLPAPYARTEVFASFPGEYGHDTMQGLGNADADGFTPTAAASKAHSDLVKLVAQAWDDARSR